MPESNELKLRYIIKQKNHKQKTTKKPWPLPSGTTPFLKKERIKLKSDEKEGCQTPQIPIPWNNPMLDVVNSAVAPSTNKNWRYITTKSQEILSFSTHLLKSSRNHCLLIDD